MFKTMIVPLTACLVQALCGSCGYCRTNLCSKTDCPVVKLGKSFFSVAGNPVTLGEREWDSCRLTGRPYSSVGKGMIMLLCCWEMWLPLTLSLTKESCYNNLLLTLYLNPHNNQLSFKYHQEVGYPNDITLRVKVSLKA